MATKNKTRYAILGVLSMGPCSGYDIKKFCDQTISHFWHENFGHIYPVLGKLSEAGLIEPAGDSEDRRKAYRITEAGLTEFHGWLGEPAAVQPPRSELLLKLFFGGQARDSDVTGFIAETRKRHVSRLDHYREMEAAYTRDEKAKADPRYPYWLAPLRYGIIASEAMIRWCDETVSRLERRD